MTAGPALPTSTLLTGEPRLVVGWRTRTRLEGRRIETEDDTHPVLREISERALDAINSPETVHKPYSAFGTLETGEVYDIDGGTGSASDLDSASLVDLIKRADDLIEMPRSELEQKLAFYAIVWGNAGADRVGLVRKTDARAILARGAHFFTYEQTLKTTKRPDLVLDNDVDLVVSDQIIVMMSETRARTLMNDIDLAQQGIAQNIAGLAQILGGTSAISTDSIAAFQARAASSINFARRLARFNAYYNSRSLDPAKIRQVATERSSDPDSLLDANGVIVATEDHVEAALDLIEGRFFKDPISDEERRADRLSTRRR